MILHARYVGKIIYIVKAELEYEPGTKVVYSDLGFILLGYILEKIGGTRIDQLCNTYVFKPIGMDNTCFNPKTKNVAATEIDPNTGNVLIGKCHDENARFLGGISGHAGLFSNIEDLIKFANMLINKGALPAGRLISVPAFEMMTHNYTGHLSEDRGIGWWHKRRKRQDFIRGRLNFFCTVDNKNAGRYMGELQIIRKPIPQDFRVNVVGKIDDQNVSILDYIQPGKNFKLVEKGGN